MNSVYGNVFNVSEAEAADAAMANERAEALRQQFIFDVQTHFVRDDYSQEGFLGFLQQTATDFKTGMDPNNIDIYLIKFENYVRQIYLNSDTDVSVLSGAPFDDDSWEFLSNAQIAEAAKMVNTTAGHTRMLAHNVVTPGQPGWSGRRWTAPWPSVRPRAGSSTPSAIPCLRRRSIPSGSMTRS